MLIQRCLAATILALSLSLTAQAADQLKAGVAFVEITPPIPFRMSGYFYERLSTGTKDPLQARAIVLQQGNESAAFVFCDLIGVPFDVATPARKKASELAGIPVDHIAVAGTHTHTGPLFFTSLHNHLHEKAVANGGKDKYDSEPYRAELVDKIAEAIVKAQAAVEPVEIRSGYAQEDRLSFNRRFHMKDGSVRFNPPTNSPDIVRVAGPIDPQVGIILFSKPETTTPLEAIVSFAMHLDTTSDMHYSADYVKSLDDQLKQHFGPDFKLLFGTGTCGNINHRDVTKTVQRNADEIGPMLADSVVKAIQGSEIKRDGEPSLAVRSVKVPAPLRRHAADEIEKAKNNMALVGTRELDFLPSVEACTITDIERLKQAGYPGTLEVQAFRLNRDTAIVMLPSEIFVELGLAIKAASPFKTTLVIELANDDIAYIPTKQAFGEGSYEITNSRVEPGTGERLAEAAIKLLKELE